LDFVKTPIDDRFPAFGIELPITSLAASRPGPLPRHGRLEVDAPESNLASVVMVERCVIDVDPKELLIAGLLGDFAIPPLASAFAKAQLGVRQGDHSDNDRNDSPCIHGDFRPVDGVFFRKVARLDISTKLMSSSMTG
jgi:hypothetical protein